MTTVQIAALVVSLTAALAYVNARWIKLPPQIGMLAIALAGSIAVVVLDDLGVIDASHVRAVARDVDFGPTLVHGMLGLLLFAGSLHVRLDQLAARRWAVGALAVVGTLASTAIVAAATYALAAALGGGLGALGWLDCLLFGAIVSPTDPIAVLGMLKHSRVSPALAVQFSGESLFNDGVGVVVFTVLLAAGTGGTAGAADVAIVFAREVVGGAAFGLALGWATARLLRAISEPSVEVLVSLGLVLGGYATAEALGVSAPIAAVVAGILVGNRPEAMTSEHAKVFWQLVDDVLNAVLFLALGLEATRLQVSAPLAIAAAAAVGVALAARLASVALSLAIVRPFERDAASGHAIALLTWGGLRGGLAVALALSLPEGRARDTILVMTYAIVAFAVLVQGLTFRRLLRRCDLA